MINSEAGKGDLATNGGKWALKDKPTRPLISVVVPAYNEIENLPELYRQLLENFSALSARLELLIVDDA